MHADDESLSAESTPQFRRNISTDQLPPVNGYSPHLAHPQPAREAQSIDFPPRALSQASHTGGDGDINGGSPARVTPLDWNSQAAERAPGGVPNPSQTERVSTRFVGDLNPEAVFLDRASEGPPTTRHDIGVWLEQRNGDATDGKETGSINIGGRAGPPNASAYSLKEPYSIILAPADEAALIDIYFLRVNIVLPILVEADFREELHHSRVPKPLVHAVLLTAAKDTRAKPHLRVLNPSRVLCTRDFSKMLYSSIVGDLRSNPRYDKLSLIRILTLISLHSEGPDGAEDASMHLAQAIHHSHTIGLQIARGPASSSDVSRAKLFWCIWTLDKLNASTNGRPVMMFDQDISVPDFTSDIGNEADKPFKIWLRVARLLNEVIALYRPFAPAYSTGWEHTFPGFEDIVAEFEAWSMNSTTLLTLHLFYLAVAMVSSRSRLNHQSTPQTASSLRQSFSASQVTTLICGTKNPDVLPLPVVPYGISLALSVAYKKVRNSRVKHIFSQGKAEFETCQRTLEDFRENWWAADLMATLSRTVLLSMDPQQPGSSSRRPPTNFDVQDDSSVGLSDDPLDNIDQIFGNYLDPNFPLNYEDLFKIDNMEQFGVDPGPII